MRTVYRRLNAESGNKAADEIRDLFICSRCVCSHCYLMPMTMEFGAYEVFELVDGDRGSAMGLVERTSLYEAKLR
jgi:hypothetical protein